MLMRNAIGVENAGEFSAGELAALVGIEDHNGSFPASPEVEYDGIQAAAG
jgi:hypothetical protein